MSLICFGYDCMVRIIKSIYKIFHSWKCLWKCRLRNSSHILRERWVNAFWGTFHPYLITVNTNITLWTPNDDYPALLKHLFGVTISVRRRKRETSTETHTLLYRISLADNMCAYFNWHKGLFLGFQLTIGLIALGAQAFAIFYYSDVLWRLKSHATQLFVQQFAQSNSKNNIKATHY